MRHAFIVYAHFIPHKVMAMESGDEAYDADDEEKAEGPAVVAASESLANSSALRYLLMKACRLGHVTAVRRLLRAGVKVAEHRSSDEVREEEEELSSATGKNG